MAAGGWAPYSMVLYRIDPNGQQDEYDEENGLLRNNVRSLLVDDRDRLWIGTKFGLNLLEHGRMRVFTIHQGMPNDNISCSFQDDEGNLWFGTDGAGALKYAGDRFVTYTVKDGLCSDSGHEHVLADTSRRHLAGHLRQRHLSYGWHGHGEHLGWLAEQHGLVRASAIGSAMLWFGTSDGLVRLTNGVVQRIPQLAPFGGQPVLSLNEGPDGTIWSGMREGLVGLAEDGTVTHHPAGPDGPGRSVRNMQRDRNGDLWMATDQGLVRYDGTTFRHWTKTDGMSDNTVHSLLLDDRDRLWTGTANGISCLMDDSLRALRLAGDFGSNYIDLLISDAVRQDLGRHQQWSVSRSIRTA